LFGPRIEYFKEVGWAEPFAAAELEMRRTKQLEDLMTTMKSNLKKKVTLATKSRIEREAFKKRMVMIASFVK
jgi:hypothetical protein